MYYTKLLHVSAKYPGHFQGVISLIDVYSVYDNLSYIIRKLHICI